LAALETHVHGRSSSLHALISSLRQQRLVAFNASQAHEAQGLENDAQAGRQNALKANCRKIGTNIWKYTLNNFTFKKL
jgi:hypothetical protein